MTSRPQTSSTADPKPLLKAGIAAHASGDLDTAATIFNQVLRQWPGNPHALHLLGATLNEQGDHSRAVRLISKSLDNLSHKANVFNNLGNALNANSEPERAERAYREALRLSPDYAIAHCNLAKLLIQKSRFEEAGAHYRQATSAEPQLADAWLGLARVQRQMDQPQAAENSYQRVLALRPDDVGALIDLAAVYQTRLEARRGLPLLRRAIALDPDNPYPHFNLGQALGELGEVAKAESCHRRVLELAPATLNSVLAVAKAERDRGDWSGWEAAGRAIRGMTEEQIQKAPPPFLLNLYPVSADLHLRVARSYSSGYEERAKSLGGPFPQRKPVHRDRLRLGFVSADFRQHPVGYLTHRLFAELDRNDFEVFAYSLLLVEDSITLAVQEGCDVYRSCARLSDLAIARRIADDGIDILVDLTGYTTYSRPTILALRPAPVAIQHAGYVSSLGARFVEWQLADHYLVGPQQRSAFSERLLFMPHCVFPVSPLQGLVSVGTGELSRQEVGLPEDVPVLASFNAPYKLDPETFDSWATILRSAPDAVLWLYDGGEPKFSTNLRSEAKARGVDPNRLFFAGKIPYPKHLQRYALADLFLDSFVYNGGATTIDALRMGLPVLTLPGNGPLARMGGSIVHAAGLGDQVAISPEAYVNRAVEVANSREAAAEWRRRVLAARQAPLFDLREWTRDYGKGLLAIWSNTANNQTGDIDLSAQAPA